MAIIRMLPSSALLLGLSAMFADGVAGQVLGQRDNGQPFQSPPKISTQDGNVIVSASDVTFTSPGQQGQAPLQITSVGTILSRLSTLESSVQNLTAFKNAALRANCTDGGRAMIGVQEDGSPICSMPLQSRLHQGCPVNTSLAGYQDGEPICRAVVNPLLLEISNEEILREVERLVNGTDPHLHRANLECAMRGLVYDARQDRCEPAYQHQGCPPEVPGRFGLCDATKFDDNCTTHCPAGFTTRPDIAVTHDYHCGPLDRWIAYPNQPECHRISECPGNTTSERNGTALGFPEGQTPPFYCECNSGFRGNTTWDTSLGRFNESCAIVPCPTLMGMNAIGAPPLNCRCPERYIGRPTWRLREQNYDLQTCQPVACPRGATGAPRCVCDSNHVGRLSWTGSGWSGTCTRKIDQERCAFSGGENGWARPRCANGLRIRRVTWACYGRSARCSNTNCECGRTLTNVIHGRCRGRTGCDMYANNGWWGDPCGGWGKPLVIKYTCSNYA